MITKKESNSLVFRPIKKSNYSIMMQCPFCVGPQFSVPVEMIEPSYVAAIEHENIKLREALTRIEKECSRDDTTAWKIASDALELYD